MNDDLEYHENKQDADENNDTPVVHEDQLENHPNVNAGIIVEEEQKEEQMQRAANA